MRARHPDPLAWVMRHRRRGDAQRLPTEAQPARRRQAPGAEGAEMSAPLRRDEARKLIAFLESLYGRAAAALRGIPVQSARSDRASNAPSRPKQRLIDRKRR